MSTAVLIGPRLEVLSDQLTRGCCIDRLSRHTFSETGFWPKDVFGPYSDKIFSETLAASKRIVFRDS
jgi:hypothetical protein